MWAFSTHPLFLEIIQRCSERAGDFIAMMDIGLGSPKLGAERAAKLFKLRPHRAVYDPVAGTDDSAANERPVNREFEFDVAPEFGLQRLGELLALACVDFAGGGHFRFDHAFGFGPAGGVSAGDLRQYIEAAIV